MLVENQNPVKAKIKNGGKVSVAWLHSSSPIMAEIVAESGFDVGVIDMEHGLTEIMTQAMRQAPW